MSKKVMVVAVHPDDESLGCGGTIFRYKEMGFEVHWLILTSVKDSKRFSKDFYKKRLVEIEEVSKIYGFDSVQIADFPAGEVEKVDLGERIDKISNIIKDIEPNIIFTPFYGDVHSDHRSSFEALMSSTKKFRYPFIEKILMMEVISETEFALPHPSTTFIPNVFSDITNSFDKKIQALGVFKSEMGEHPFPRSVENVKALATYRGAMAGCKYAESFMLIREFF